MKGGKEKRSFAFGFSLLEVLVVLSITLIVATIFLISHSKVGGRITLGNLASEMVLTVRQAQVYALATRELNLGSGNFSAGYGANFNLNNPDFFVLFGDADDNKKYDIFLDELVEKHTIKNGYSIKDICVYMDSAGAPDCASEGVQQLDIFFKKPLLSANINSNLGGPYAYTKIIISSRDGYEREIYVWSTGHAYHIIK